MTFKIPLNRFIVFAKPYINVAAGAASAWLIAKVNVLGIPGLGDHQNEIATGLAAGAVALVTWGAAQLGDLKWLRGHHIELEGIAAVAGASAADIHPAVEAAVDHATDDIPAGDLPSDAQEFSSPPSPEASDRVAGDTR